MTEPTNGPDVTLDEDSGAVTVVHGGTDPVRAAVLADDVVVTVVLLPADWPEQDPDDRWSPDEGRSVVVLADDEHALAVPGARRTDGAWVAPLPPDSSPAAEPAPQATTAPSTLAGLVEALRALTPAQAAELQAQLVQPDEST